MKELMERISKMIATIDTNELFNLVIEGKCDKKQFREVIRGWTERGYLNGYERGEEAERINGPVEVEEYKELIKEMIEEGKEDNELIGYLIGTIQEITRDYSNNRKEFTEMMREKNDRYLGNNTKHR